MINFKDKKILITGATGGIGGSLVKKFSSLGGIVLGTGTKPEKLDIIKKENPDVKTKKFNLSEHNEIENFINSTTSELGGLDILINNAGMNIDNLSLRMKDEDWKKVIDVNLTSTFLLSKYAIKNMLKNKFGRIVNITSIVGHTGNLGQSNYSASKSGIIGMSKSLAIEYAKKNITINCVSPGFIVSDMTDAINEKVKLNLISRIPMAKLGTAEDVSNCVAFLSSDLASYVTGETIHVNGGMYMSWQKNRKNLIRINKHSKRNLKMTKDVGATVKKIVADHLGVDEQKVTEEASFIDDLGADSLDTVELVMAFEEEFGSEISDSEAEKILTVGDAIKFIESHSN